MAADGADVRGRDGLHITVSAEALAGRAGLGFSFVALGAAAASLVASSALWRYGLRRYTRASA